MYAFGVDLSGDAVVLAASGLHRLVWAKPYFAMIGGAGMPGGRIHRASTLELRSFKRIDVKEGKEAKEGARLQWDRSQQLFTGGRLSKARLQAHASEIDAVLGVGVTALIELPLKYTIMLGDDEISAALTERRLRSNTPDQKNLAFLEAAKNAVLTSYGERL